MLRKINTIILIIASSCLLILAFPNFNLWPLAWIALLPLLFAVENKKPREAFFICYLAGFLFFLGTIYWLAHVTLPGMIVVVAYLALYFGLFGLISNYWLRITGYGLRSLLFIPALWVALELLRSHLLGGFGWALLAHSQSSFLYVIQISDITGAYGVSFLVVLVNAVIFFMIKDFQEKNYSFPYLPLVLFLVFISLAYGTIRMNNIFTGERIKVAVVQGNIPQAKKWDFDFREEILNRYESLTKDAAKGADIVIWPETSVPGYLESEKDLFLRVSMLARAINTPLFVGAPREDKKIEGAYYNSAILFLKDGIVADRYDKIHLVPFGEYVPFKKMLSFVERLAPSPIGDFSGGKDYTVFKFLLDRGSRDDFMSWRLVKKVKFSCLICFEDIFPGLTRQFVKKDANFLVNITNDGWFGRTSAPYQHAQCSIFRAVENRVNVVRAANTGLSCIIDQKGRVIKKVEKNGENIFVDGFVSADIVLTRARTFYTKYGDIFAYLCVIFILYSAFIHKRSVS